MTRSSCAAVRWKGTTLGSDATTGGRVFWFISSTKFHLKSSLNVTTFVKTRLIPMRHTHSHHVTPFSPTCNVYRHDLLHFAPKRGGGAGEWRGYLRSMARARLNHRVTSVHMTGTFPWCRKQHYHESDGFHVLECRKTWYLYAHPGSCCPKARGSY